MVGGVSPLPPLSGPTTKKTTFFMCVFPKVLIIIIFMGGGAKLALGGNPQKIFALRAKMEPPSSRYTHTFYILPPPPEQDSEYAPA